MLGVCLKICAIFGGSRSVNISHSLTLTGVLRSRRGPGIALKIVFQVLEIATQTGTTELERALGGIWKPAERCPWHKSGAWMCI